MLNQSFLYFVLIGLLLSWVYQNSSNIPTDIPTNTATISYPNGVSIIESTEQPYVTTEQTQEDIIHNYLLNHSNNEITDKDLHNMNSLLNMNSSETKEIIYNLLKKYITKIGLYSTDSQIERDLKLLFMKNNKVTNFLVKHLAQQYQTKPIVLEKILYNMLKQCLD